LSDRQSWVVHLVPVLWQSRDLLSARFSARVARAGVPAHTVEELIRLLRRRPVTGGGIFDLQILAIMNVNPFRASTRSTPLTSPAIGRGD
jgi:hypothetical protein